MNLSFNSEKPIFMQLIEYLQLGIISGAYMPGEKLPSVRDLAASVSVNPNTMQRALSELETSGLIYTQRTNGRFITEDKEMIARVREATAVEQVEEIIKRLKAMGFNKGEILNLIQKVQEDEE